MDFKQKYFKYKNKYLKLKNQEINSNSLRGGAFSQGNVFSQGNAFSQDSSFRHNTQGTPRWKYLEATTFCSINEKKNDETIIENIALDNYDDNQLITNNNNNFIGYIVLLHGTQKDINGNPAYNQKPLIQLKSILEMPLYNIKSENIHFALEIAIRKSKCRHNPKYQIYVDVVELLNKYITDNPQFF
jgi:hypothetical protein